LKKEGKINKRAILYAMTLILEIANGDFTNWSLKKAITGFFVHSTHGEDLEIFYALAPG
jgi:hypothetical protein